ncbi:phosphoribosylaminoimidazolesuccinocarboxamide synthase [Salinispira pacifica]|uniref:phosphoribosylaminoimidazolesuccinocarboxamide synthase n=1 Tax=Salinispira pacifica TaxID=1307761 RepID=UPI0009E078AF|nr:phosphoribosylaminoimidazolesuccinocarboxamide synthase [Salinispira pacifica]
MNWTINVNRDQLWQLQDRVFPGFAASGERRVHGIQAPELPSHVQPEIDAGKISFYQGKVRDSLIFPRRILMITSDRVSAFDRILDLVPLKGEVLNRISSWWFRQTEDIIPNHIISRPGGRSLEVRPAEVLPVEVVVRGFLTGSAWRDYLKGDAVSGISLPGGMKENQEFDEPLITPSTKAEIGDHDEPVSREEIIRRGLVEESLWNEVEAAAQKLYARGRELAAARGLILVDTKYEFGLVDGKLILVDEIHTPDSSRYWFSESYASDFQAGRAQKKLDKEYLRRWLMDQGFQGQGTPPEIPAAVKLELAWKYISAYQQICGEEFEPDFSDIQAEYENIRSLM